jgi:hypothetical protein
VVVTNALDRASVAKRVAAAMRIVEGASVARVDLFTRMEASYEIDVAMRHRRGRADLAVGVHRYTRLE